MKKRFLAVIGTVLAMVLSMSMLTACSGGTSSSTSSSSSSSGSSSSSSDNSNSGSSNATDTEITKLVVGFDQNFPPYGYVGDDGEFTGFDLDMAKAVADKNGWEVEYKPINWDNKDQELNSGSIDCIWNGFTYEGREDGYTWTEVYMENTQIVVVKSDSGITKLADLAGKTVMAQVDSAALGLLEDEGDQADLASTFKALQQVPEYQSAFLELEQGTVDAVALDLPVALFQTAGKESMFTILEDDPLSTEHYGVGFKLGNTELRDKVQAAMKELVADGTVEKLCEKYAPATNFKLWCMEK